MKLVFTKTYRGGFQEADWVELTYSEFEDGTFIIHLALEDGWPKAIEVSLPHMDPDEEPPVGTALAWLDGYPELGGMKKVRKRLLRLEERFNAEG